MPVAVSFSLTFGQSRVGRCPCTGWRTAAFRFLWHSSGFLNLLLPLPCRWVTPT